MADSMPKSLAPLLILQVLWECSDVDNPLTQEQIRKELKVRGLELDRKAVQRHLAKLMEWDGVTIDYDKRKGLESQVGTNFYINARPFTDADLRLIIDSISANPVIDENTTRALIEQVAGLSSVHFKKSIRHLNSMVHRGKTENKEILLAVDIINQAISQGVKIAYSRLRRDADGRLSRTPFRVKVSPVQIIVKNQKYFLLFASKRHDEIKLNTITLDHICDITLKKERAIDIRSIPEYRHGINYDTLLREHPELRFLGEQSTLCTFRCPSGCLDDFREYFGTDLRVRIVKTPCLYTAGDGTTIESEHQQLEISVITDPFYAVEFALRNLRFVRLVEPYQVNQSLRCRLKQALNSYQMLEDEFGFGLPKKVWEDRQNRDQNFSLSDITKKD